MPNKRSGIFLLSNFVFLCIRGSDLVIVTWNAKPSKWNQALLCCQGIQSAARKESKQNQVLETGSFCYCRGLCMLKGLSCAKPNCFLFHQCCCKILKSFWHTNDSSVQTRFCLPSVDNGCALAGGNREIWLCLAVIHWFQMGFPRVCVLVPSPAGLGIAAAHGQHFRMCLGHSGSQTGRVCAAAALQVEFLHILLCMKHCPAWQCSHCGAVPPVSAFTPSFVQSSSLSTV